MTYRNIFSLPAVQICLASVVLLTACSANGAWDLVDEQLEQGSVPGPPEWRRSIELVVAGTESNEMLFGFPVMVRVPAAQLEPELLNDSRTNLGFFTERWPSAHDALPHSVAAWNPEGESIFWVLLPTILAGNEATTIYLAYGGSETVDPAGPAVWENGYTIVMHFEEGSPSDGYVDSSPFGNHSVPSTGHTEPGLSAGVVGSAVDFVQATDALIFPNSPSLETMQPFTFSMFVNYRAFRSVSRLLAKGDYYVQLTVNGGNLRHQFQLQFDGADTVINRNASLATDTWRYVTITWDGTDNANSVELRNNLVLLANAGSSWGSGDRDDDSAKDLGIGNQQDLGGNRAIDGLIDELRVSRVARSVTWLATERRSMIGELVIFGTVESRD